MIKLFFLFMCFCPSVRAAYISPTGVYGEQCGSTENILFSIDGDAESYAVAHATATGYSYCYTNFYTPAIGAVLGVRYDYFSSVGTPLLRFRCVGGSYVTTYGVSGSSQSVIVAAPSGCTLMNADMLQPTGSGAYMNISEFSVLSSSGSPYTIAIDSTVIRALLDDTTMQAIVTAPQSIADFLNFEGRSGGVHAFIWGGIYMMCFFAGFICGTRLV